MSLLRPVEHLQGNDGTPRQQPPAYSPGQRCPPAPSRPPRRHHGRRRAAPRHARCRAEPCAGRRSGSRFAHPAGRRAGHRKVHTAPPDRPAHGRTHRPLCKRRRERAADQAARRPPEKPRDKLHRISAPALRDAAGTYLHPHPERPSRPPRHRLHPDPLHRDSRLLARQHHADPRMRRRPAQICQGERSPRHPHRTHHERGQHRRTESAGTYRRLRVAVRRRPPLSVPHPAQHQEPFRLHRRTGYLRNAFRRPATR